MDPVAPAEEVPSLAPEVELLRAPTTSAQRSSPSSSNRRSRSSSTRCAMTFRPNPVVATISLLIAPARQRSARKTGRRLFRPDSRESAPLEVVTGCHQGPDTVNIGWRQGHFVT